MRFIAHRVFEDGQPLRAIPIDPTRVHGVELDIRCDDSGAPMVEHAPIFVLRSRRRALMPKSFQAAVLFLAEQCADLDLLYLDIKSTQAAAAVGRDLRNLALPFRVIFNCWHTDDAAELRRHLENPEIFYCFAPIFARRTPKGRFRDLYLHNSFPFFNSRLQFRPKPQKRNLHNINVKLINSRRLKASLPRDIDGICVHSLFCGPELAALARRRGLKIAVYGIRSDNRRKLAKIGAIADYAIIRDGRKARRSVPTQSLDIAI